MATRTTAMRVKEPGSKKRKRKKVREISHVQRPPGMELDEWQRVLRRQFGQKQKFRMERLSGDEEGVRDDEVFATFQVLNPAERTEYRVTIRGERAGESKCTCPDFATNTLGTCKHLEFVLGKIRRNRANRARLAKGYSPERSEVVLSYGAKREVRFVAGMECPPELQVLAAAYFSPERVLRPAAFGTFARFLGEAGKIGHEVRVHDDALAFIAQVRDAETRRKQIDRAFPKGIRSAAFRGMVKAELYDYQREAVLFGAKAGRCLIGDEMGLGKTLEAIATAEVMAKHLGVAKVLVICPTSLKHQWAREVEKFTTRSAKVVSGLRPAREAGFAEGTFFTITNYDTVHRDLDLIARFSPDLVILDEAQRIKNWSTRAAKSVKKVSSPYAIVLTGTPLENRLEELVSIVQFVDQHRLGPTFRFLADHQIRDEETGRVIGYRNLDGVSKALAPVLIRRKKDEVLTQLPERLDKTYFVRMTPEQMNHHEENREVVALIVGKWRSRKYLTEAEQRMLMIGLQNMRMSCNSTYLLDQTTDFGVKADEAVTLVGEVVERPEEKVVIFSQWQRTHHLLARRLRGKGVGFVEFNGSVPGDKRGKLVDRFRDDPACKVFLSTDAGGVGLNLQHASVVINMDLPWNPAVMEQRIARVHRMGQKRPVRVVNFVAQGTIEESMLGVLKFKKSLFAGVLDGGETEVFLGGSKLVKFMEVVEKTAGAIPEAEAPAEVVRDAIEQSSETAETNPFSDPATPNGGKAMSSLLEMGVTLLRQLTAPEPAGAGERPAAATAGGLVRTDGQGKRYLHVPMPDGEVVKRLLSAVEDLLGQLSGGRTGANGGHGR